MRTSLKVMILTVPMAVVAAVTSISMASPVYKCESLLSEASPEFSYEAVKVSEFKGTPLAVGLVALSERGHLLYQEDARLAEAGLLVPCGGLCASTDVVNVMGALHETEIGNSEDQNRFYEVAPSLTRSVLHEYSKIYRQTLWDSGIFGKAFIALDYNSALGDGRRGAVLEPLLTAVSKTFSERWNTVIHTDQPPTDENMSKTFKETNSLILAYAFLYDDLGKIGGPHAAHAILIAHLDSEKKEIYVSDPNYPNQIYRVNYELVGKLGGKVASEEKSIQFTSPFAYSYNGKTKMKIFRHAVIEKKPGKEVWRADANN